MDNELKGYFDRLERHVDARFGESQAQIADFRRDVDQRFEQVDDKVRQVDDKVRQVDDKVRRLEGEIRQTHVVVEDVRGLVQTVAEGVVAVREGQQQNSEELRGDIGEVRDLLTASYGYLDRRLTAVESGR